MSIDDVLNVQAMHGGIITIAAHQPRQIRFPDKYPPNRAECHTHILPSAFGVDSPHRVRPKHSKPTIPNPFVHKANPLSFCYIGNQDPNVQLIGL